MSIISYFREENLPARPWTRFFARTLDIMVFFIILAILHPRPSSFWSSLVVLNLWYIFAEAILLSTVGTTLGKWMLRITVTDSEGKRLSFSAALKRTFLVYLRGLALNIPFIKLIALIIAYNNLKTYHITSWDEDCHTVVTHQNPTLGKWLVVAFFALIIPLCMAGAIIYGIVNIKKFTAEDQQELARFHAFQEMQKAKTSAETATPSTPDTLSSNNPTPEPSSQAAQNNSSTETPATPTPDNTSSSTQDTTNQLPSWMHEVPSNESTPSSPQTPATHQSTSSGD